MFDAGWDELDEAFEQLEAQLTAVVRGITVQIWNDTLRWTPQYYGRMAASWTYSLNQPRIVDRSGEISPEGMEQDPARRDRSGNFIALRQGALTAINLAQLDNRGNEAAFKLGDTVFLANGVNHGEGPYSQDIEDGRISLRPANRPGMPVKRAIDAAGVRYFEVPADKVTMLKNLRIGVSGA